jgi:hypothetical protein
MTTLTVMLIQEILSYFSESSLKYSQLETSISLVAVIAILKNPKGKFVFYEDP